MGEVSTIGALATAPAPAGIAVVRVSGPKAKLALRALFRGKRDPVTNPRRMCYGTLIDHKTGNEIDQMLAVYMPGPHSFTGEDIAELQYHGSPLITHRVLQSLFAFGVEPAEPGEFSRRAFLNGKLDLVQAEAIADLINASSEHALKIASEHLAGRFSNAVREIGEPLRDALAEMEAAIDFSEEDIEPETDERLQAELSAAQRRIEELLRTYSYGHAVKEGFRVLLCGRPNAGKSSLLNLFLGRDRAIVSEIPGTTRDVLEEEALVNGYRFVFCDSAGITHTDDVVERIGVELARDRIGWADLVLLVVDATDKDQHWRMVLDELRGKARLIWMVTNKIDLNPGAIGEILCDSRTCAQNFYISARTQDGFCALQEALVDEVRNSLPTGSDASEVVTNERHRSCLLRAHEALQHAIKGYQQKLPPEVIAAETRIALSQLEELVGKTHTEDLLGRIFSKFCIGK